MTLAPSEKHLEDWIVANLDTLPRVWMNEYGERRVLGQQVRLPFGVADIVAYDDRSFTVIELKRDNISAETFVQILRYKRQMSLIWDAQRCEAGLFTPDNSVFNPRFDIHCTVIGHSITDQVLADMFACHHIYAYLYEYQNGTYTLRPAGGRNWEVHDDYGFGFFTDTWVGKRMVEIGLASAEVS